MQRTIAPDTIVYRDMTFGEVLGAAQAAGTIAKAHPELDLDAVLTFHQRTCLELMKADAPAHTS